MFNEFSILDFISIVAAYPTLPLALAPAPAVALAMLDVAIYKRKQEAKKMSLD